MSDEIVREQIAKTIKIKERNVAGNRRSQEQNLDAAALFGEKADDVQKEIDALRDHLDTLGGPVEEEK